MTIAPPALPKIDDMTTILTEEQISEVFRVEMLNRLKSRGVMNIVEPYDENEAKPGPERLLGAACIVHDAGTSEWRVQIGLETYRYTCLPSTLGPRIKAEEKIGHVLSKWLDEIEQKNDDAKRASEIQHDVDVMIPIVAKTAQKLAAQLDKSKVHLSNGDLGILTALTLMTAMRDSRR